MRTVLAWSARLAFTLPGPPQEDYQAMEGDALGTCDREKGSPFWGLMMKDCVAPFTSRQYPSIRSAMFSAMVSDGAVTVRG